MTSSSPFFVLSISLVILQIGLGLGSNLNQKFDIAWGDGRGKVENNGEILTLSLDNTSGSGFQSKDKYLFGHIDMQLKLVPGNSAGTVTAYYVEVEKLVSNLNKGVKNKDDKTPQELFTEEHKELKEKGEQWMRNTSSQCLVVTTLIATIAFAAAFTVPGGNDDEKGTPILLQKNSFIIFAISDALSLFSSVTALIMFLAILTARYAEEDFLLSLPMKLIIGLSSLLVAIANMMVSFGAGILIVLGKKSEKIIIPAILLFCVPVVLFGMLQLPLLVQMVRSTYGCSIFYRSGDRMYRDIAYKNLPSGGPTL